MIPTHICIYKHKTCIYIYIQRGRYVYIYIHVHILTFFAQVNIYIYIIWRKTGIESVCTPQFLLLVPYCLCPCFEVSIELLKRLSKQQGEEERPNSTRGLGLPLSHNGYTQQKYSKIYQHICHKYVYIYTRAYIYIYIYILIQKILILIYTYIYVYIYIYTYVHIYIYVYVYMCLG